MNDEFLLAAVHVIVRVIEVTGVAVILVGAVVALYGFAKGSWSGATTSRVQDLRSNLGRAILLGLEFLVAADIINTVAMEPTLESLAVLAGIVAIRTFLSFSLEVELEGTWPWARHRRESRERIG